MEKVAIALGGSIVAPAELNPAFLSQLADAAKRWSHHVQLFIVIGGGNPARRYIATGRALGIAESELDRIGIAAIRLNAQLIATLLSSRGLETNLNIPNTAAEAIRLGRDGAVVVMGGTEPGHSTDYVAAEIAVAVAANRLVIATNVDGVYTADPKHTPNAQRLPQLDFERLLTIIGDPAWKVAGSPGVIDGPAALLVSRRGQLTCVVDGRDLDNLGKAVRGEPFNGTRIQGKPVKLAGVR